MSTDLGWFVSGHTFDLPVGLTHSGGASVYNPCPERIAASAVPSDLAKSIAEAMP
jgi:hypothetical protein